MKSKKAAMEMSVGTIVTIVLLMTVLILGLGLVRNIFGTSSNAIDQVDSSVQNQLQQLFSEDTSKRVAIYPVERTLKMKQGDSGGFGLSIKNIEQTPGLFSYEVMATEIGSRCQMTLAQADQLIIIGKADQGIQLASGASLESPIIVKFEISDNTPLCTIRYSINLKKDGAVYGSTNYVDLVIK